MFKFTKQLIGILLWPFAAAACISAYKLHLSTLQPEIGNEWQIWAFPIGFLAWVVLFYLLPRPVRTYVFAHELTHALWALVLGAKVGKIEIRKKGGHVQLSKTNFLIALAPYFFPFYTMLLIGIYSLLGIWLEVERFSPLLLAAAGLTWSFHITFTLHVLSHRQPDIQDHGRIFSYTVILIMNMLVIALMMILLGHARLPTVLELLAGESSNAYQGIFEGVTMLRQTLTNIVKQ
ncbi:MAG: hypothetical protein JXR40_03180 [Pontiellaceae bacterium]|nr:hypothetical protein [Pontiellaceae bacterium]